MLRLVSIRTRLAGGFALLLVFAALLLGVAGFGLYVSQAGIRGIVHGLIPVTNITVSGRTALLESRFESAQMVASIFDHDEIQRSKAAWDKAQAGLDAAMEGFSKVARAPQQREDLDKFRAHRDAYRKAWEPVARQLAEDRFSDAKEAQAAMHEADASAQAMVKMLANIETDLAGRSSAIFGQVEGTIANAFKGLIAGFVVFIAVGIVLAWRLSRSITQPLVEAREYADRIAGGDLRESAEPVGRDEAADMMRALSTMRESLATIVADVRSSADGIRIASAEVATGNADLSVRTEQTAGRLQQTASSVGELAGNVKHSAESAVSGHELASAAAQIATRGGEVVSQVVATMEQIDQSSRRIADITGVIDGIAFQTNILALNAAVEAARAGEQGRGFAVVASEVRSLAQRSAEAAREIKGLIGASVEKVEDGSRYVQAAGTTMTEVVASVRRVNTILGDITSATVHQNDGMAQINAAVSALDQMTQQNAALVEQSAAASESLKDQALRLTQRVAAFRVPERVGTPASGAGGF